MFELLGPGEPGRGQGDGEWIEESEMGPRFWMRRILSSPSQPISAEARLSQFICRMGHPSEVRQRPAGPPLSTGGAIRVPRLWRDSPFPTDE